MTFSSSLSTIVVSCAVAVAAGAAAGAVTGRLAAETVSVAPSSSVVTATTSTQSAAMPTLVKAEARVPAVSQVPDVFTHRSSGVADVYRRVKNATDDRSLTSDHFVTHAVAVTSDGWFVTDAASFASLHLADVVVWFQGKTYTPTQAVVDKSNGTVYVKIGVSQLFAPAFADSVEVTPGMGVWVEDRPGAFTPTVVTSLEGGEGIGAVRSSETVSRRYELPLAFRASLRGAAVWNPSGVLIGVIDAGDTGTSHVVPASSMSASLASLLKNGTIVHAAFGVRTLDLAEWRFDGDRGTLPTRGALLRDEKKSGKMAVAKDSPAAKAKLKAGDVILSVERDILDGRQDLAEILAEYQPDARVTMRVWRDGTEIDVPVVLGNVTTSETLK